MDRLFQSWTHQTDGKTEFGTIQTLRLAGNVLPFLLRTPLSRLPRLESRSLCDESLWIRPTISV